MPSNNLENGELDDFIHYIKQHCNLDLSTYRRQNIARQIGLRMKLLGIHSIKDYQSYFERSKESEFTRLLADLCTSVTDFFRDVEEWHFLSEEVVSTLVEEDRPLRLWCVGCASGKEAYTLAMVFAEAMGLDEFAARVTIFASDIDERSVQIGRDGTYSRKDLESVPPHLVRKYFRAIDSDRYTVNTRLRRGVSFFKHDVLAEPSLTNIDLITCRNMLMYFNRTAQHRILQSFATALNENGFLFVGKAESVGSNSLFERFNHQQIFRKRKKAFAESWRHERIVLMKRAFEASPCAQVVVNREGVYVGANRAARRFLQFSATLQGEHFDKLPCAAWMPEVVAKLKVAFATSQPCSFDLCPSSGPMEGRNISVNLQPLLKEVQELQGMVITFHETEAKAAVFEPQLLQNN